MCCHKPLDRSQEGLECIVGSTFLLLLFSFWENSRRGRLKILSRKKNVNKTKKGKTEFPGKTVNSQEAWHGEELEHSKYCGNSHGSISASARGLEATSQVFQDCVVSCTLLHSPTFKPPCVLNSSAFRLAPSHLTPYCLSVAQDSLKGWWGHNTISDLHYLIKKANTKTERQRLGAPRRIWGDSNACPKSLSWFFCCLEEVYKGKSSNYVTSWPYPFGGPISSKPI